LWWHADGSIEHTVITTLEAVVVVVRLTGKDLQLVAEISIVCAEIQPELRDHNGSSHRGRRRAMVDEGGQPESNVEGVLNNTVDEKRNEREQIDNRWTHTGRVVDGDDEIQI